MAQWDSYDLSTVLATLDELLYRDVSEALPEDQIKRVTLQWLLSRADWTEVADAWAYASASTITVPTNATLTYQKWDRIRFKQGGSYKYFVITSLTATVLTMLVNTDFTVANSAITDIAYSRMAKPFGFPDSFAFAPATANLTQTSATITARVSVSTNGFVNGFVNIVFGASTAISGAVTLTLPITIATYGALTSIGITRYKDATGGSANSGVIFSGGQCVVLNAGAAYAAGDTISATIPFTWATSDDLDIQFSYFAA